MFCPKCGQQVDQNYKYCPNCRNEINYDNSSRTFVKTLNMIIKIIIVASLFISFVPVMDDVIIAGLILATISLLLSLILKIKKAPYWTFLISSFTILIVQLSWYFFFEIVI
jgi:uncharacterized membrane protein YvbJ